jgi:diaminopimelate decarboxylase
MPTTTPFQTLATIMTIGDQVKKLMQIFQCPVNISMHKTSEGKIDHCCEAALTHFSSVLRNQYGLFGALAEMSSRFKWGFARCEHLCQCVSEADNLDCGAGMSLALTLLKPIRGNYRLATVEVIVRHSQFNTTIWKHRIREENPKMSQEEMDHKTIWIEQDCHYHTCVGLISTEHPGEWDLKLWDFGVWVLPSHSPDAFNARLAIRVKLLTGEDSPRPTDHIPHLKWGNVTIQEGEWVNLWPNFTNSPTFPPPTSLPSKIFISGCHMSGSPCPGVGLARSLRLIYPDAGLVAVDTAEDLANGASDPIFTSRLSLPGVMAPSFSGQYSDWQVIEWDLVYELLSTDPAAVYLPSRDSDVDIISTALDTFLVTHEPPEIRNINYTVFDLDLGDRVLCPSPKALDAMAKPAIYGASNLDNTAHTKGCHPFQCFHVPEYLDLSDNTKSFYELQNFCNIIGYPVIVKGSRQGAAVCPSWPIVVETLNAKWAKDGYVQKLVVGFSMGLTFAAYKGELLGAVLMQKNVVTADGKAWGGELRHVPASMLNDLALFCKSVNFTGGSELEYVEDIDGVFWAIDWNPRFPAFIYSTQLAGMNLPALLMQRCVEDMKQRNTYRLPFWHSLSLPVISPPASLTLPRDGGINFTRTVIETIDTFGAATRSGGGGTMIFPSYSGKSRHHEIKTCDRHKEMLPNLPPLPAPTQNGCDSEEDESTLSESSPSPIPVNPMTATLQKDLSFFTSHAPEPLAHTPYYVLSTSAAALSLNTQKEALEHMHSKWREAWLSSSTAPLPNFTIQPFVSVKTQPHQAMLRTAHECGFYAECITIAEIRASLAAGFREDQIILTGPGKFWEGPDTFEMPKSLNLRALFADSLEDLRRIISIATSTHSTLQAEIIGVRLALGGRSRFGINAQDPQTLLDTAAVLKSLPSSVKLGFHFHHASSTLGPQSWWCALESFLSLTATIASIADRTVNILDFGGGWQPHFLSREETAEGMVKLFNLMIRHHPSVETVQFEPGKSVSERCGALVCRVLEIREFTRAKGSSYPFTLNDEVETSSDDSKEESLTHHRACIVDACIAELSVAALHVHPLLWRPKVSPSESWSLVDHDGVTKGTDVVWGRSCMEFDVISTAVILPSELSVGDYMMIAFTGAYDTVMQYDFADGLGRDLLVVK